MDLIGQVVDRDLLLIVDMDVVEHAFDARSILARDRRVTRARARQGRGGLVAGQQEKDIE